MKLSRINVFGQVVKVALRVNVRFYFPRLTHYELKNQILHFFMLFEVRQAEI